METSGHRRRFCHCISQFLQFVSTLRLSEALLLEVWVPYRLKGLVRRFSAGRLTPARSACQARHRDLVSAVIRWTRTLVLPRCGAAGGPSRQQRGAVLSQCSMGYDPGNPVMRSAATSGRE